MFATRITATSIATFYILGLALFDLFATPAIRNRTIIAFLMPTTSAVGFWGISTWVPPYIGSVAAAGGLSAPLWASFTGMAYNVGSIAGYISLGFLADAFGRKPVALAFFAFSLLFTPVSSRGTVRGGHS